MFEFTQNLIRKNIFLYYFFGKIINSTLFLTLYRPELKIINRSKKKLSFLDIGSNDGIFVNLILLKFDNKYKKIYVIEPITYLYKNLKSVFKSNRKIKLFKLLASNTIRKEKIIIPYIKFFNLKFYLHGYASNNISAVLFDLKQYFSTNVINNRIKFKYETINTNLIDSLNVKVDFIKIIMAGCQYDILKGSEKTIKKNKPVIYLNQRSNKVEKFLKNFGYNKYIFQLETNTLVKVKAFSKEHHVVFFMTNKTYSELFI